MAPLWTALSSHTLSCRSPFFVSFLFLFFLIGKLFVSQGIWAGGGRGGVEAEPVKT